MIRMMGRNPIKVLKSLFFEGGVEIVTPGVARTFIQPDADIIFYLEPEVVSQPDQFHKFQQHFNQINHFLTSLRTAKYVFDRIFVVWAIVLWGWAGIKWYHLGKSAEVIIKPFLLGFLFLFAKPLLVFLFRYCLRRYFRRLCTQLLRE